MRTAAPSAKNTTRKALIAEKKRSGNDIDDPLRHHDNLLRRAPVERSLDEVKFEHSLLDASLISVACDCQIPTLLAVDLHRQNDLVFHHQCRIEHRPGAAGDQRFTTGNLAAQRCKAVFGQM